MVQLNNLIITEVSSSVHKSKAFVSYYRHDREQLKIRNLLCTLATILHMVTKAVKAMCKYYGRSLNVI
jgi:transposase